MIENEILVAMLSAGAALIGALIGGAFSYSGAKKQIEYQNDLLKKEKDERDAILTGIILLFLSNEIITNYEKIDQSVRNRIKDPDSTKGTMLREFIFTFEEYNKNKYKLLEFDGPRVVDIIEIYQMFYLLQRKNNFNDFTDKELANLKKGLLKCEEFIATTDLFSPLYKERD